MCGLVSILSFADPVDPAALKKATDALAHRGPDDEGFWRSADGRAALGHRRLSIIDLAGGAQPISNAAGDIHVIVNGEFYDFEDIREDLKRRGHRFKTSSDSEIALHLYAQYGLDFVGHLRGEFALVLFDERNKRLVAARDRFGVKPLCYARNGDALYLASEAKAIFAAGYPARWDEESFFHACSLQYTLPGRTLFDGVRQLPPGHLLICEGGDLRLRKYWDLDYPPEGAADAKTDAQWIESFRDAFEDSLRTRLRADVPVCFHLSGGIDSSAVAATARRLTGRAPDCFTVRFGDEGYDEYPVARETAQHMDATLHAVPVTHRDMVEAIPEAVYYSEGLAINGHLAGKYLLNRAIRKAGFKVALTGEGADEVLAGYPHFREDLIGQGGNEAQRAALYRGNAKLAGVFLAHGDMLPAGAVTETLGYLPSFLKAKASLGYRVRSVLSDESLSREDDAYAGLISALDVGGQLVGRGVVDQSAYIWSKTALANYILRTLGDGCEMAHSVEGRLPFLDHKLFDVLRRMPMRLKINNMVEKYVLRESMKDRLTATVYERQKHPFIAPPANDTMNGFIQDHLRSAAFARMPFFSAQKTRDWLDGLGGLSAPDRIAAEPVLMMMLTSYFIGRRFGL